MGKILVLSEKDIKDAFKMSDAISAVSLAAIAYSKGDADIPLRANIGVKEHNGDSLYMYGYVKGIDALGVKMVSVYPDNPSLGLSSCPATMVLENAKTGEVKCLLDGTFLTRLRTGALSGVATKYLSRTNSTVFALIGTGGQAESQLEAVLNVRNINEVRVYSKNYSHVENFVNKVKSKYNVNFVMCKSSIDAITDADIVTCVTVSNEPVIDGTKLKKGVHVNAVGSYTPEMSEIDEYTVLNSSKIIVDTMDGTINETGDFIKLINKGKFSKDRITGELGNLVLKECKGRENDDELTLFETTGSSVFDLVTAEKIYELAMNKNKGNIIFI